MGCNNMEFQEIQLRLEKSLDQKRYRHTEGVLYTSAALCMQHGIDVRKGMIAGLLHDCAKAYKTKEQYRMCQQYQIPLSEVEEKNPALIHAKLGAYLAESQFGIHEEEILSAIRNHTTGKPGMSTLDKIVYIADYIEPHRELPMVDDFRKLAFQDLDQALYQLLESSLEHLAISNKIIDHMTIATYEYYKK